MKRLRKILSVFVILLLAVSLFSIGYAQTVETRYMRSDNQTVNGVTAYKLGTSESGTLVELWIAQSSTVYVGIRVSVIHSDGSETRLDTQASGVVIMSAGTAQTTTLSAGYSILNDVALSPTDAIKVEVYGDTSNPPQSLLATFITEQLGASKLNAATWTVYYRLRRTAKVGTVSNFYFRFGVSGDDSYITNFAWTSAITKSWHDIALWTENTLTRKWLSIASFSESLLTRKWFDISSTIVNALTRSWNDISSYVFSLLTRKWIDISSWVFESLTRMWNNIATFTTSVLSRMWNAIAFWTFDLLAGLAKLWHNIVFWSIIIGDTIFANSYFKYLVVGSFIFLILFLLVFEEEKKK